MPNHLAGAISKYLEASPETYLAQPRFYRALGLKYERWKKRKNKAKRTEKMGRVEKLLRVAEKQEWRDIREGK